MWAAKTTMSSFLTEHFLDAGGIIQNLQINQRTIYFKEKSWFDHGAKSIKYAEY